MINIEQMRADNVQSHLIFLASMDSVSQFEKIAMNIKNPQIYRQFMALDLNATVWDYAYAAELISRADADLMNSYEASIDESNHSFNPIQTEVNENPGTY